MENGIDRVVDATQLENNINVNTEVSRDKVEDKYEVLGGAVEGTNELLGDKVEEKVAVASSESKDLEDEVFVEALESTEKLHEEGVKFESDGGVESVGDSSLVVGNASLDVGNEMEKFEAHESEGGDSGSVVVIEKSDVGSMMDKFEEPVFVPAEPGNPEGLTEVVGEEKVVDSVGGESVRKIDEGGTVVEVEGSVLNGGEVVSVELQDRKGEGLHENPVKVDTEDQDDKSGELIGDSAGLDSEDGIHKGGHPKGISATVDTEHGDTSNGDLKDTIASVDPEHHEETPELTAASAVPHTALEESTVVAETGSLNSLDKFVNEKNEDIQADTANLRAEDNKDSEPEHAAEKGNDAGQNNIVSGHPERIAETYPEKQNTPVNKEGERHPEPKLASLSGKSLRPPSLSHPAGLGRAAPLLEPATRAMQQLRANGADRKSVV